MSLPKWKNIFPFDHLLFRSTELQIGPILVNSFISFKTFDMLRFSSGKSRLMMTDKEKEFQSYDQVWELWLLCFLNSNPFINALKFSLEDKVLQFKIAIWIEKFLVV